METLQNLASKASKILVVSHLTPDCDAYASLLFMYATLKENFPEKEVFMSLETKQSNALLSYLPYFEEIHYDSLYNNLRKFEPDLVIITDASSIHRISNEPEKVKGLLQNRKTALFDHHTVEETNFDLYVQEFTYSSVDLIYDYIVTHDLRLPNKWEEYFLTGFIPDSLMFYFQFPTYRRVFDAVATIMDHGYSLREYQNRLLGYTPADLVIFRTMSRHLSFEKNYIFTYVTWKEYREEIEPVATVSEYKKARRHFIDEFMIKTYGYDFAVFVVPDDNFNDEKTYSGSIRSKNESFDCTVIAKYLQGGGHTTGGGFVVVDDSIEGAITQVKDVIEKHEKEARKENPQK